MAKLLRCRLSNFNYGITPLGRFHGSSAECSFLYEFHYYTVLYFSSGVTAAILASVIYEERPIRARIFQATRYKTKATQTAKFCILLPSLNWLNKVVFTVV